MAFELVSERIGWLPFDPRSGSALPYVMPSAAEWLTIT
jgi:hypothetical protein